MIEIHDGIVINVENLYDKITDTIIQVIDISCDGKEYTYTHEVTKDNFYVEADEVYVMLLENEIRGLRLK